MNGAPRWIHLIVFVCGVILAGGIAWGTLHARVGYNNERITTMEPDVDKIKTDVAYLRGQWDRQFGKLSMQGE